MASFRFFGDKNETVIDFFVPLIFQVLFFLIAIEDRSNDTLFISHMD